MFTMFVFYLSASVIDSKLYLKWVGDVIDEYIFHEPHRVSFPDENVALEVKELLPLIYDFLLVFGPPFFLSFLSTQPSSF